MEQSYNHRRLNRSQLYGAVLVAILTIAAIALMVLTQSLVSVFILSVASGLAIVLLVHPAFSAAHALPQTAHPRQALIDGLMNYVNVGDAVLVVDPRGHIIQVNEGTRRMLSAVVEFTDKSFDQLWNFYREDKTAVSIFASNIVDSVRYERLVHQVGDTEQFVNVTVTPYYLGEAREKNLQGYVAVVRDVTHRKDLDDQEQEFIALTAHELRAPLSVAETNLSTVLASDSEVALDPSLKPMVQNAYSSLQNLDAILHDITTLYHTQERLLDVELSQVSPNAILDELAMQRSKEAAAKGIRMVVEVEPELHSVRTSSYRVAEILQNYIANALKFTNHGGITLRAKAGDDGSVVFSVSDTGIGISPADQDNLFEKFSQISDFRTRTAGGTGLGLFIVKQIAHRLTAKVWCESRLSEGSTFYLEVPPYSRPGKDKKKVSPAAIDDLFKHA